MRATCPGCGDEMDVFGTTSMLVEKHRKWVGEHRGCVEDVADRAAVDAARAEPGRNVSLEELKAELDRR